MHSYGITSNATNDERTPSNSENGEFTNGNVNTTGFGGGGSQENGVVSGGSTNHIHNSNNHTNGCSSNEDHGEDKDGVELNGLTNGNSKRPEKSNFVISSDADRELLQLMGQQLRFMGLDRTVSELIRESGCRLDHPTAAKFRNYVMQGEWNRAESILYELKTFLESPKHLNKMRFLLLEQKFLECIEDERNVDAVYCLQYEIAPLNYNSEKLVKICSYLFANSIDELKKLANWEGKCRHSRLRLMEKLQNFLPPSIMLPPRRLQTLLNEAHEHQIDRCPYHNFKSQNGYEDYSLLVDHVCSKDNLPSETRQILTEHRDEVWFLKFSNDGTRLATGSKDGIIYVWDIDPDLFQLTMIYTLSSHSYGVSYFSWSPDDHYLVALGPEESSEIWLWDMHSGTLKNKICQSNDDSLTSCAWHKDSKKFVVGGTRGQFYQVDLNGTILDTWEGVRVQALAYHKDGKTILAADTHYRIRAYNFEDMTDKNLIKEDHSIMSFVCDDTGRLALINIENQGVHLWDLEDRVLVRKFQGPSQGNFTIHSCFGGADQVFVASGSEDNKVYIWQLKREKPISVLKGHSRSVNCVAWNPVYPHMLASASDDSTVRIWGAKNICNNRNEAKNNTASVITSLNNNHQGNVINSVGNSLDEVQSMARSSSSSPSSTSYQVANNSLSTRDIPHWPVVVQARPPTTIFRDPHPGIRSLRPETFTLRVARPRMIPPTSSSTVTNHAASISQAQSNNSDDTSASSSSSTSPSSSSGGSNIAKT